MKKGFTMIELIFVTTGSFDCDHNIENCKNLAE